MIYDELAPDWLKAAGPPTEPTPLPTPRPRPRPRFRATPGADDHLVVHTDNRLRPADLELEQPPQDPGWTP